MMLSESDLYILIKLLTIISSVAPAYQDFKTRLIDDRVWSLYIFPYAALVYGIYSGLIVVSKVYLGIVISILIVFVMVIASKFGFSLGGADFIMFIIISPLSFVFEPDVFAVNLIPGFIQVLLLSSIISVIYVILKCIYINRSKFSTEHGFFNKLKLLYGYWVYEADDLKEIILEERNGLKFVTPGIPMVTFIFISMVLLSMLDYIIMFY